MKKIRLFKKKLKIEWKDISELRNYFLKFLSTIKDINPDKVNLLVYIISELLENIVKYTSNHICYLILVLEKSEKSCMLHIITENDLASIEDKNYKRLVSIVHRVNKYSNLEEMFIDMAKEYKNKESELNFGFALIRKLTEGKEIKLSSGVLLKPGIRIHVLSEC
jgi:hypothetical protein